jgi:hypothetical protein
MALGCPDKPGGLQKKNRPGFPKKISAGCRSHRDVGAHADGPKPMGPIHDGVAPTPSMKEGLR